MLFRFNNMPCGIGHHHYSARALFSCQCVGTRDHLSIPRSLASSSTWPTQCYIFTLVSQALQT